METIDNSEWDVVIADTGFASSLLALSLSRSGKRILHLDKNDYYGGAEAALSLSDAEAWASRHADDDNASAFSHASVSRLHAHHDTMLSSSRAYSLALAPHLIYAKSNLVPALVSSRCHSQLDFQAVGSFFILHRRPDGPETTLTLTRIPSSREDVFQDSTFDLRAKRLLMKFLRFVATYEEQPETWQGLAREPFPNFLQQKFGLPKALQEPITALTMLPKPPTSIATAEALPRIAQHIRSIGVFGPGFAAVLPKWGGLAEIAQVACRAGAVGGGVFVLGKAATAMTSEDEAQPLKLELNDGEDISTTWLCGSEEHVPPPIRISDWNASAHHLTSKAVMVISSPLSSLFPPTSEGGVMPAGAVVVAPSTNDKEPPVHISVHTSDAGECPMNQSMLYASTVSSSDEGYTRLDQAVSALLEAVKQDPKPDILWKLQYQQRAHGILAGETTDSNGCVSLPVLPADLVLADAMLENVKRAWQQITRDESHSFMNFGAREDMDEDD